MDEIRITRDMAEMLLGLLEEAAEDADHWLHHCQSDEEYESALARAARIEEARRTVAAALEKKE